MYVLIPFGVPVHAEGAGMIQREKMFFSTVLVCTGFGKSIIPRVERSTVEKSAHVGWGVMHTVAYGREEPLVPGICDGSHD